MPGIVTHYRLLKESIHLLSSRKKRSPVLNSLLSLFSTKDFLRAAFFGSLGPNIFDYIPKRNKNLYYGSELSFLIHDGGCGPLMKNMVNRITSCTDKNTEWASAQRAYLYGLISHMVSDTLFHPFIFYWSGFPDNPVLPEIYYYREQNLLFMYNMDNYYQYFEPESARLEFSIEKMFPFQMFAGKKRLNPAVKHLILEAVESVYPEQYKKIVFREGKNSDEKFSSSLGFLDLIPRLMRAADWIKRNKNAQFSAVLKNLRRRKLIYSDFIVRYPSPKKINRHVLNFHQERWNYPAGKKGLNYESVDILLYQASEKTVELWERIEGSLFGRTDSKAADEFSVNAYTGQKGKSYADMRIKEPVKLFV